MDKKTLIGVGLLAAFLLLWQSVIIPSLPEDLLYEKKPAPTTQQQDIKAQSIAPSSAQNQNSTGETPQQQQKESFPQAATAPQPEKAAPKVEIPEELFTVDTQVLKAVFSSKGGHLKELFIKDYHPDLDEKEDLQLVKSEALVVGHYYGDLKGELKKNEKGSTLVFWNNDLKIIYRFDDQSHFFDMEVQKTTASDWSITLPNLEATENNAISTINRGTNGAISHLRQRDYGDNSTAIEPSNDNFPITLNSPVGDLVYTGFRNNYFSLFIEPHADNSNAHLIEFQQLDGLGELELTARASQNGKYRIYAGPLDKPFLYDVDSEKYGPLFNYTGINVVIHFLLWLLTFYNSIPGINMGMAIILLTITVKAALFPMNLKAQSSMFMMSKIGPEVKALQKKYENDRQQLGVEQMKLFKEHGVNPVAGCLPMLIQMPVLISLFSTVGEGFPLRHAPFFGWIQDLSAPDRFASIAMDIPILGNGDGSTNINLLVLFYIVTMLVQQSMMPKSEDPQQQQMQKMMKFMMIGFAVILYNYSSGLMLYFVGSNTLGMAESWYIRNRILPAMEKKRNAKK